jgi:NTE family protein
MGHMTGKTALVLSGGGAKGAFECGAEKYAREVKGYHWDIIAGVSVGALNGAMLSMEKYERLFQIWNTISNDQVYTGGFNLWSAIKLLFGAKSFYGNAPMRRLLEQEFKSGQFKVDLWVGSVSLISGEYMRFKPDMPNFDLAVLSSTVMPIIWEPVDISPDLRSMVDGGVRNISPLGDILDTDPDEIVIINCSPETYDTLPGPPSDILKIGLRTLDILLNEIFRNDLREFLRINALVKEAEAHGIKLHNPNNGKELKYFKAKVIEPKAPLGDTLDFSQPSIQHSLHAGWERAREILGR